MLDVLIVDDNPIVRAALRGYLETADEMRVVGEAKNGGEALVAARRVRPTVTLLDYRMPLSDGLSVIEELSRRSIVLVLTSDSNPDVVSKMLRGGARGYLVHGGFDPPELLRAVRAVASGQSWLNPLAASVATAAMRDEVARERLREKYVEQRRQAWARLGLTRREEVVVELLAQGMPNAEIAGHLELSEKTVKNHLNHIFAKLHVRSRTEAVARWTAFQ